MWKRSLCDKCVFLHRMQYTPWLNEDIKKYFVKQWTSPYQWTTTASEMHHSYSWRLLLLLVQCRLWYTGKGSWESLFMWPVMHLPLRSQPFWVVLGWPVHCLSAGPSDRDTHQSLVGVCWTSLSQKKPIRSHPDKVTQASCHYPQKRQG